MCVGIKGRREGGEGSTEKSNAMSLSLSMCMCARSTLNSRCYCDDAEYAVTRTRNIVTDNVDLLRDR